MIRFALFPTLLFLVLAASPQAVTARTTDQDQVLSASILPGWRMDSGAHMAGLRLDLASGWKTYWRSPGDAGIPPQFDWSASDNLKSVRIHWPSPVLFHTNGYQTIGYRGGVIFPVELEPRDPSRPIVLRTKVDLGICRDICLPASVTLSAELSAPGAADPNIRKALDSRPVSGKQAGLTAATCAVEPIDDGMRITATLTLPRTGAEEAVAFEPGDPRIWVSKSQTERHGAQLVSVAELVGPGGRPFALDRSAITLTVISDNGAVEIRGCTAP